MRGAALALAFASLARSAFATPASFGTDTRAFQFFSNPGFEYAGGYLHDLNEYNVVPNGRKSDTLATTFYGSNLTGYDAQGHKILTPASAYHFASANLATGKLRAYTTDPVGTFSDGQQSYLIFNQGRSNASFSDNLTFHFAPAMAGQYVTIGLRTRIDGTYTSGGSQSSSGSAEVKLQTTAQGYTTTAFYDRIFGAQAANYDYGLTSYGHNIYGFDITVPAENFDLGIFGLLSVNAYGSTVDYSHTAALGLVLPKGVTYTSASGVFLTKSNVDGVPEPATIAIVAGGLGMISLAGRRFAAVKKA